NDDTIVRMDRLDRVLHFDEQARTVEVQCGVTVEALTRAAAARGLTIATPTLYPKPTIGGAIAVGAHGTDFRNGGMEDRVVEMKIVDADGGLRTVGPTHPDLAAAKVALGTLGVIYSVTLWLDPQFDVATQVRSLPVERVFEEFEDLQASCAFLEMFWFPFQDHMWIYMMDPTQAPRDPDTWLTRRERDLNTAIENLAARTLIPWISRHAPALTPVLNTVASRMGFHEQLSIQPASEAFHFQRAYAKCWEMEYTVPAEYASQVWREGVALVNHYAASGLYPVNLALHGRFTGRSTAWIAPNYGRPTCYIDVTTAMGTPHWQGFFRELEAMWFAIPGARPHWGKMFFQCDRVAARYDEMNRFLEVRERWDPERVFLNRFLEERVFQLPPDGRRAGGELDGCEPLHHRARVA
ncbi:MAG TPA: D-arabinono-1,4-lactone oxidase, partial [Candidatus Binatia bacterium]|nr:D-arabinono-1,4-lactone oxidase [Candidatus Binatia bacterium]